MRRGLTAWQQHMHAQIVIRKLLRLPILKRAHHIALYKATDGELNPGGLRSSKLKDRVHWYLPIVRPVSRDLRFLPWPQRSRHWTKNGYGIKEPRKITRIRYAQHMDVILVPLVGFDQAGNRLGMGSGYYDRTLNFVRFRPRWKTPILIGLGHDIQHLETIVARSWDVPMTMVVTEKQIYRR
jgi:5-formyltetrahydrofolate cyclo-ligase